MNKRERKNDAEKRETQKKTLKGFQKTMMAKSGREKRELIKIKTNLEEGMKKICREIEKWTEKET